MDTEFKHQDIAFEWDSEKEIANFRKHGVEFKEACELFFDPFLMVLEDKFEEGERRHHVVGMTKRWKILFAAFVWRGDKIRLVSARIATNVERKQYELG